MLCSPFSSNLSLLPDNFQCGGGGKCILLFWLSFNIRKSMEPINFDLEPGSLEIAYTTVLSSLPLQAWTQDGLLPFPLDTAVLFMFLSFSPSAAKCSQGLHCSFPCLLQIKAFVPQMTQGRCVWVGFLSPPSTVEDFSQSPQATVFVSLLKAFFFFPWGRLRLDRSFYISRKLTQLAQLRNSNYLDIC